MRKKLVMIFSIIILVTLTSCKAWQQNITTDEGEVKEEVCITQQPENENITTKEEEDIMIKTLKYGIKPAEYGLQAGAEGTSFQFFADGSDGHLKAPDIPTVELDSDDPIEIAKYYTNLYNSWQWSGWKATYKGHSVSFDWGEILVDGEHTGIKSNERILYDKAKEAYLSGEWDGKLTQMDSHYVELSKSGEILIDGYLGGPQENLDLPSDCNFDYVNSTGVRIPGQGYYMIESRRLVKYQRGEKNILPGDILRWEGYVLERKDYKESTATIEEFNFYLNNRSQLMYDEYIDKLYLTTYDKEGNTYTYTFPDYNESKMIREE